MKAYKVKYRIANLTILLGLLIATAANGEEAQKDEVEHRHLLESGDAADAAILVYFGEVEEEFSQLKVLRDTIERLRQSGEPKYAPALAAFLNRDGVYERETPYVNSGKVYSTQSKIVRFHLAEPATDAWLELAWGDLDEKQRINAILDTIRPNPGIHLLWTDELKRRASALGKPLGEAFYADLLNPDVSRDWRSGWIGNMQLSASELMTMFPPNDQQKQGILESSRTFPKLRYLVSYGSIDQDWPIALFQQLLDENRERHVTLFFVHTFAQQANRAPQHVQAKYRDLLLKSADTLLDDFRENRIDPWSFSALFVVESILFEYGKNEESLAFFVKLQQFFKGYDADNRPISPMLKKHLRASIDAWMENVDFRIKLWTN